MKRVAVEVTADDGAVLRGEAIERSRDWAVLVHDLGEDIDAWCPVVSRLAGDGMSTLALDLRGHGGSDGDVDPGRTADDIGAALALARGRGARRLYLCAAGRSAAAAVEAAGRTSCAALVLVAPLDPGLEGAAVPRLAVVSSVDPAQQAAAATLRRGGGWALVANVPVEGNGLGFLSTKWSSNVVEYVRVFLKGQRLMRVPAAS